MTQQREDLTPVNPSYLENDSRCSYEGKMESRLKEIGAHIDELTAKAEAKSCKTIDELKIRREKAHAKFNEVKDSSTEAWSELKKGMDEAWVELGQAFEEVKSATGKVKSATGKAMSKFDK